MLPPPDLAAPGGVTDDAPQRRRLPPDERRANIFDAALAAFSELGYDRATLSDLVERIGVSKGCLYHHFESKEQLFLGLLRDRLDPSIRGDEEVVAAATGSREEVLRTLLARIWDHLQEPGQIELTTLALTELPKVPDAGRYLFDEVVARKRTLMRTALERGESGQLAQGDIEVAAVIIPWMIVGVALGLHLCRQFQPVDLSSNQVGEAVTKLILHGVGGVCPEEKAKA